MASSSCFVFRLLHLHNLIINAPFKSVTTTTATTTSSFELLALPPRSTQLRGFSPRCGARRRVRYEEKEEEEEEEDEEEYGHNEEIAMLEFYTQSARGEALLVHAKLDEQEVEVLIFKGFSSCLSYSTSPDPARSVLPARAVIKSIDRIKGPFDPTNIEYLERGLTWEAFKSRLASK
ncbi:hypothetical protein Tsubulata_027395 [Turnera subulata]|uniref:DUF7734 domain-containing protein n=1 Tax=Turnera subulata TaxID=218843 RepID=A0A9Q0JLF3_9ROSI|nr:hypothetical protein Tsubulata_027395 [Turnera subulata]